MWSPVTNTVWVRSLILTVACPMLKCQSSWYCIVLWNNLSSKWHSSHMGSNRIMYSVCSKCQWRVKSFHSRTNFIDSCFPARYSSVLQTNRDRKNHICGFKILQTSVSWKMNCIHCFRHLMVSMCRSDYVSPAVTNPQRIITNAEVPHNFLNICQFYCFGLRDTNIQLKRQMFPLGVCREREKKNGEYWFSIDQVTRNMILHTLYILYKWMLILLYIYWMIGHKQLTRIVGQVYI